MLYETLNQPLIICIFLASGFLCGFVFDIINFIKFLFNNKKFIEVIGDFLATSIILLIFYQINLKLLYGEFRLFALCGFCSTFLCERHTLGKLFVKFYSLCYNAIQNGIKKIKKITRKKQKDKES